MVILDCGVEGHLNRLDVRVARSVVDIVALGLGQRGKARCVIVDDLLCVLGSRDAIVG